MKSGFEIRLLNGVKEETLLDCFNKSFSDYLVKVEFTPDLLRERLKRTGYNADISFAAFSDNELVGFILHGFKSTKTDKYAYNIATGVVPNARRKGLGTLMYAKAIPILVRSGITKCLHEVIIGNDRAIAFYEKNAFTKKRELRSYSGYVTGLLNDIEQIEIKQSVPSDPFSFVRFWSWEPSWQNAMLALRNAPDSVQFIEAKMNGETVGYIAFNKVSKRVMQFAVKKNYRNLGIGKSMFSYLASMTDGPVVIIDVDSKHRPTNAFLERIGLRNNLNQYEMIRHLS